MVKTQDHHDHEVDFLEVVRIRDKAIEAHDRGFYESAWNDEVHSQFLCLALDQEENLEYLNV
jgi:hypothetical protein